MNNKEFLKTINAKIYKILIDGDEYYQYYVMIPFFNYSSALSYFENFNYCMYICLSEEFLYDEDIEDFIKYPTDKYDYITIESPKYFTHEYVNSSDYLKYALLNNLTISDISLDTVSEFNNIFMKFLSQLQRYTNLENTDYLYKSVIDFYKNGQYDDATVLMNIVFNSNISTTKETNCGCSNNTGMCTSQNNATSVINTGTELVNVDTATCLDKYKASMYQWLQEMLSNYEFYCHWFIDDEGNAEEAIIDKLINLIKLLLKTFTYEINHLGSNTSKCKHKNGYTSINKCESLDDINSDTTNDCSNYSILNNYIKVLDYVKANEIEENKNKIYIYGKKFAEIFPLLNF